MSNHQPDVDDDVYDADAIRRERGVPLSGDRPMILLGERIMVPREAPLAWTSAVSSLASAQSAALKVGVDPEGENVTGFPPLVKAVAATMDVATVLIGDAAYRLTPQEVIATLNDFWGITPKLSGSSESSTSGAPNSPQTSSASTGSTSGNVSTPS